MKIVMRDGRVFQGTAVQIVQAMKTIAFGVDDLSLCAYIDWVASQALRFEGVELVVAVAGNGDVEAAKAKALLDAFLHVGVPGDVLLADLRRGQRGLSRACAHRLGGAGWLAP